MAILEILQYRDPRLNHPAERVEKIDAATRKLVDDMAETMYAAPGVGLAATQVDVHKQIILIDVSEDRSDLHSRYGSIGAGCGALIMGLCINAGLQSGVLRIAVALTCPTLWAIRAIGPDRVHLSR